MALEKLKLTGQKKEALRDPVQFRRARMIANLSEQLGLANALLAGEPCTVLVTVYETDPATGVRQSVQKPKRARPWYWHDIHGKWFIELRYSNKLLEVSKGKTAVEVGAREKLPEVIQLLIEAVQAGELDAALAVAGTRSLSRD